MTNVISNHKGIVLTNARIVYNNQIVEFRLGQVIDVDGWLYDAIKMAPTVLVQWDGEGEVDTELLLQTLRNIHNPVKFST